MGAPLGNKNAVGNKGGGSKTVYAKQADAEFLWRMFFEELKKDEVMAKLKSGKYSLKDVWISKGYGGNERVLSEIFKKLFPENINLWDETGRKQIEETRKMFEDYIKNERLEKKVRTASETSEIK